MMAADHDSAVAVIVAVAMIPAAVPATVMSVKLDTRATVIAVIVAVAANAHAEIVRAGDRRHAHCDRREGSEYVRKLLHVLLLCSLHVGEQTRSPTVSGTAQELS